MEAGRPAQELPNRVCQRIHLWQVSDFSCVDKRRLDSGCHPEGACDGDSYRRRRNW
ncbi:hypothetical protein GF312_13075 [Candidatus Poribacteria bacterium]|nr:hypothetical protein [Candidatus Poribacteria bacterium]